MVKSLPAMRETWVWSLGWEDPLEAGMATHSSILPWRIPMDRGAWWATVHGVGKSRTWQRLSAHGWSTASSSESFLASSEVMHAPPTTPSPPNTDSWEEVPKLRKDPVHSAGHKSHHGPRFCCEAVCVCMCVHAQRTHTLDWSPASVTFWFCCKDTLRRNGRTFTEGKVLSFQNTVNAKAGGEKSKTLK